MWTFLGWFFWGLFMCLGSRFLFPSSDLAFISSNKFSAPSLSFWNPYNVKAITLMVSPSSLRLFKFFFLSLQFSLMAFHYLFFRSVIHSSAASSLLFIPFIVFLFSFIEVVISFWFFFMSVSFLKVSLRYSTLFSCPVSIFMMMTFKFSFRHVICFV